jgi:hypothetical protein
MIKVTTLTTTFIKKFYNFFNVKKITNRNRLWVDVPNTCNSRREKDFILFDTLDRLEQKIKIIKK